MAADTESRQQDVKARNAEACPVIEAVDQVGTPWRLNVLYALREGEQRFNDIQRSTGARSKTLSAALDELVENDVIDRRMEEAAPVAVYYSLTTKGEELLTALSALDDWAQNWGETVPDGPQPRLRDH